MKTTLRISFGVVMMSMLVAASRCPAQAASTTPVAVVDIGYLFQNHSRFKEAIEQVKQEVRQTDAQFRGQAQEAEKLAKRLEAFKPDSADYKQLEADVARRQGQLQAEMALKRKELLQREGQVYFAIYSEIQKEVQALADNHGIGLVLRFSSDKIDPMDRASVLQGINRPVVFQRNLNITYNVLDRLQRGGTQRTAASSAPTSPPRAATSRSRR